MKTNHEWTPINTNRPKDRWTSFNDTMLPRFCPLGGTISWDECPLGARASRPHQAWHSLGHLPHLDQTGTAPWVSFGLAAAVPAHRVAACSIALKLSGGRRHRMRAGRPRSQADHSRKNGRSSMKTNHQWTPINTNRPKDRWTCFNHKRSQNASAILCPWCDDVMG